MSKYESAKYLIKIKARIQHECYQCEKCIGIGEFYYKERVDMRPPPSLVLREFCKGCGLLRLNEAEQK